jgi:site-specific DNA-methyltransferase (adenine-specific)
MKNRLFYGDNLAVLRGRDADGKPLIADESIDLIYLDPPFNSAATYNVLFRAPDGKMSDSQLEAFEDSWHWGDSAAAAYEDVITQAVHTDASVLLRGIVAALGKNDMTAYLAMMAARLIELHRVLKPTGSLYLHCDPTASHYLKILLDGIFGAENFRNEIIWERSVGKGNVRNRFGRDHDVILLYCKSDAAVFHLQFAEMSDEYKARFSLNDNDGRGPYRLAPLDNPDFRPNLMYDYKGYKSPIRGWRVSLEVMKQLDEDGRLAFPRKKDGRIARKHYLNEQEVYTYDIPLTVTAFEAGLRRL